MSGSASRGSSVGLSLCDKEVLYHGFLCFSAISVIVTQSTVLNFYIIAFFRGYEHYVGTYFWFMGDLFIVCFFATSFVSAYRYIHLRHKLELDNKTNRANEKQIQKVIQARIYKNVACLSPKYFGTLPFSFMAWLTYSVYLSAKIGVIFSSNIPGFMTESKLNGSAGAAMMAIDEEDPIHGLGTNLLKVAVGLSALVFIIMLQAHHNHQDNTAHGGYVLGVCHNIAVEVFDSATLLSLLIVPDRELNYLKIMNFNKVIVVLSCINLILPTLTLYSMSMSDFGRRMTRVSKLSVISQSLNLLVVNVPFLSIRLYLWATYNYELSLFVVKNACYIFLLVHSLYPGMVRVYSKMKIRRDKVVATSDYDNGSIEVPRERQRASALDVPDGSQGSTDIPMRDLS